MPNYHSAEKGLAKSIRNRNRNRRRAEAAKDARKDLLKAIKEHKPESELMELYRKVSSSMDRSALKGRLHRNTASRHKSRLIHAIRKVTAQPAG